MSYSLAHIVIALLYRSCPQLCNTIRLKGHSHIRTKSLIRAVLTLYWHRAIWIIENPLYGAEPMTSGSSGLTCNSTTLHIQWIAQAASTCPTINERDQTALRTLAYVWYNKGLSSTSKNTKFYNTCKAADPLPCYLLSTPTN